MSLVSPPDEGRVDIHGLGYHQRIWKCQGSMLPPRCPQSTLPHWAMLQFMVHFAVGGHIDVPGLCYGLKLCWCQWSMWPLRAVLLSVTSVLAHVDVHVTMLPSKVMGMSEVCAAT